MDISDLAPDEIMQGLTRSACEVEKIESVYNHLDNIRTVRIISKKPHPNADRLSLCTVDSGRKKLQIVCGAPNAEAGQIVPLAEIGCILTNSDGKTIEIKPGVIRGEKSAGMLCSSAELQLDELFGESTGLLILGEGDAIISSKADTGKKSTLKKTSKKNSTSKRLNPFYKSDLPGLQHVEVGRSLSEIIPLRDVILEIDNKSITHRPDLWSHFGFAREIAVIFNKKIKYNPLNVKVITQNKNLPTKKIQIVKNSAKAYFGVFCANISVKSSPVWMQARLLNVGQRPISNIVDASNYLMFEIGQPNHIFDASNLKSSTISVAATNKSLPVKKFKTLDEIEYDVPEGTVMILDGSGKNSKSVAIGGIMGGLESGVSEDTNTIFLESATFHRESHRKTLSALPLRTESAVRYEKGQDPAKAKPTLLRLAEILKFSCSDLKMGRITGVLAEKPKQNKISITLNTLNERLGFIVKASDVIKILKKLEFKVSRKKTANDITFNITTPTFRSQYDISIPEDIVEEIGRIYGYDNIKPVTPLIPSSSVQVNQERLFERRVNNFFVSSGRFNESANYSFSSLSDNKLFGHNGLKLKNPGFADREYLRVSLIPGIIRHGAVNQDRYNNIRLFECGRIYYKDPQKKPGELAVEKKRVAALHMPPDEKHEEKEITLFQHFLEFRALFEKLFNSILPGQIKSEIITNCDNSVRPPLQPAAFLHPGCAIEWKLNDESKIGVCGILNPVYERRYGLKRPALIADLYFDELFSSYNHIRTQSTYTPPSIYPDSLFEFSIVMNENESTCIPVNIIRGTGLSEIKKISLLTIYRGDPLPDDKKSVSYRITCGTSEGTLSGERMQEILDETVKILEERGFPLR